MAVYARGYRPYEGTFVSTPASLVILREGLTIAARHKGVRWLAGIILLLVCGFSAALYVTLGVFESGPVSDFIDVDPAQVLRQYLARFYLVVNIPIALVALLVGSGLIADDIRSRAMPLYLVRPLRPIDYVIGKALQIPYILLLLAFLPGVALVVLVALWQPTGHSWSFFEANWYLVEMCFRYWVVAAGSLTGLMLLISSITKRRGAALGIAGAVLFGGSAVANLGNRIEGPVGKVLGSTGVLKNMLREFNPAARDRRQRWMERLPSEEAVLIVAGLLLVAGLFFVWRRARTVEVAE